VLNRLYVTSLAGPSGTQPSLWVLSTIDGSVIGTFALGPIQTPVGASLDSSTIYVANELGQLFAIQAAPLALKWTSSVNLGSPVRGFVWEDFLSPGILYFSTQDGFVWALVDPGPGLPPDPAFPLWKTPVTGPSGVLLFDTVLYVGSMDGKAHQIRLLDGVDEAQVAVAAVGVQLSDPVTDFVGDKIYVGVSGGEVMALPVLFPVVP
jgi:hypothetical protein